MGYMFVEYWCSKFHHFASLERAGYAPYETDDKAIIQRFYFIILILSIIIFMDTLSEFFHSKMFID